MGRTRMRTAGITAIAGPVVMLELPESPDPRPNEVAIGVRAAGVRQLGGPPSRRGGRTCRPHSEFYIDPAKVRDAFAGDLSDEQIALIGATQRPIAEAAFSEPCGPPAWKDRPAWAAVATRDWAAGADVVRSMEERAGAKITEVDGSHVIMVSQPQAVSEVILDSLAAVASVPVEA